MTCALINHMAGATREGTVLTAAVNNVITKLASAGLEGEAILAWLDHCSDDDPGVLGALNEMELLINEIVWHMNHVHRTAGVYLAKESSNDQTWHCGMNDTLTLLGEFLNRLRDLAK